MEKEHFENLKLKTNVYLNLKKPEWYKNDQIVQYTLWDLSKTDNKHFVKPSNVEVSR
jgi:hypothetical protein